MKSTKAVITHPDAVAFDRTIVGKGLYELVSLRTKFLRGINATKDVDEKVAWAQMAAAITQELDDRNKAGSL